MLEVELPLRHWFGLMHMARDMSILVRYYNSDMYINVPLQDICDTDLELIRLQPVYVVVGWSHVC